MANQTNKSIFELIREAQIEAFRRGIKANSVIINENMVEVRPHGFESFNNYVDIPPMICGLNVVLTKDELPEDYSFAICETSHKHRLQEFESIGMEPDELRKAAELYRKVKEMV